MQPIQFAHDQPSHVSETITQAIDDYCYEIYNSESHRSHLGASLIGHDCSRYLWYHFRWAKKEVVSPRNGRLFNRGHREEARMIEFLQGIGFQVRSHDNILHYHAESNNLFYREKFDAGDGLIEDVTGIPAFEEMAKQRGLVPKQLRISSCGGHFGGSQDAAIFHPQLGEGLGEFKTSGTGQKFALLRDKGVKLHKPQHYTQMCVYGRARGYKYAVYLCINKNDDDLYCEYVLLDWNVRLLAEQRANDIISSQIPVAKCASNPAHWLCKSCTYKGPCWNGEMLEKNCRSCVNAVPIDNAQWLCKAVNETIPADVIPVGCNQWTPIA